MLDVIKAYSPKDDTPRGEIIKIFRAVSVEVRGKEMLDVTLPDLVQ